VGVEKTRAAEGVAAADDLTEAAGETTAADMVSGPADTRPVGTGTEVEVEGASEPDAKESE
jgi:hypothetical protein